MAVDPRVAKKAAAAAAAAAAADDRVRAENWRVLRAVLATIAVMLGIFAAVFSASTQTHEVCVLSVLGVIAAVGPTIDELTPLCPLIGTMPIGSTYTCWNCLVLAYTLFDHFVLGRHPILLPYSVVNSLSIFLSFNVNRVFDDTFYVRAARWTGYSLPAFHGFNTAFHTMPAIGSALWFGLQPEGRCAGPSAGIPPLSTFFFHLLWNLRVERSVFLDKTYFECPKWQWIMAWTAAIATHFLMGREISQLCLEDGF